MFSRCWRSFKLQLVRIIGFVGVILAVWNNGRLAREQAAEARSHERKILLHALTAELRSLANSIKRDVSDQSENNEDSRGEVLFPPFDTMVFDANLSRLGLLEAHQLEVVLNAFLTVKEANRALKLFSTRNDVGPYSAVPFQKAGNLQKKINGMLPDLEAAIQSMTGKEFDTQSGRSSQSTM